MFALKSNHRLFSIALSLLFSILFSQSATALHHHDDGHVHDECPVHHFAQTSAGDEALFRSLPGSPRSAAHSVRCPETQHSESAHFSVVIGRAPPQT